MPKFRKKPVVIEARQLHPEDAKSCNCHDLLNWMRGGGCDGSVTGAGIEIETLEGTMQAIPGDWIICGVKGEFYPCKPDIFETTYEPA